MGRFQKKSPLAVHGRRMTTNPMQDTNKSTKVTTPQHPNPSISQNNNSKSSVFGKIKSVFKNNGDMQEIDLATDVSVDEVIIVVLDIGSKLEPLEATYS